MRASFLSILLALGTLISTASPAAGQPAARAPAGKARAPASKARARYCPAAYAEDLAALSARARRVEAQTPPYAYAVRTAATYECASYGPGGELRHTRHSSNGHGTAFGFRRQGKSTLLLTNEHVAAWPPVTDADKNSVDGVPSGCKRVSASLTIVDDDEDDYAGDDIPLELVVAEPSLDVAILRTRARLQVIPWRIGRSGQLAARDVVEVKGFPLGAFRATNVGKVISTHDHDLYGVWDHDDFVIDALLSQGNSGSPVLAVSCKTREFELVGIYHAHYKRGSALNVVVAIDQMSELLRTLKPVKHPRADRRVALDAKARRSIIEAVRGPGDPPFFSLGPLTASAHVRSDDTIVFTIYSPEFPRLSRPLVVIEDRPAQGRFGELGDVYVGGAKPLRRYAPDEQTRPLLERALDLARRDMLDTLAYRLARDAGVASREQARSLTRRKRALERALSGQSEVTELLVAFAASAATTGNAVHLSDIAADRKSDAPSPPPAPAAASAKPGQAPAAGPRRRAPASSKR